MKVARASRVPRALRVPPTHGDEPKSLAQRRSAHPRARSRRADRSRTRRRTGAGRRAPVPVREGRSHTPRPRSAQLSHYVIWDDSDLREHAVEGSRSPCSRSVGDRGVAGDDLEGHRRTSSGRAPQPTVSRGCISRLGKSSLATAGATVLRLVFTLRAALDSPTADGDYCPSSGG